MYPPIKLHSKNDFAKRLVSKSLSLENAQKLIRNCKTNKELYWSDNKKESLPEKEKYVRAAFKGSPLARMLKLIDKYILAPHDSLLPISIYGGRKGYSSLQATFSLINRFKKRCFLKLDLKRFFEQIDQAKVFRFFYYKCNCKARFSNFIADICCVFEGPKKIPTSKKKCIARGFNPSTRLAVWCNLEFFIRLNSLVKKRLPPKKCDPKIAIYIDDIGITASNVSIKKLEKLRDEIIELASKYSLIINKDKTEILNYNDRKEFLGITIYSRTIGLTKEKEIKKKTLLGLTKVFQNNKEKNKLVQKYRGLKNYKKEIQKINYNL